MLVPARFLRCKGHAIVIEAVAALAGRDLHCLLLGFDVDGPGYRAELEQAIARRGLGERIRIVPGCADLPAAYMLADVVVSASTSPEAYARTIVEAQAMHVSAVTHFSPLAFVNSTRATRASRHSSRT